MQRLKAILVLIFLWGTTSARLSAQSSETYSFIANRVVPDGNAAGISEVTNLNSAISSISTLKVRLKIAGEFNGDLYGYLRHGNHFAVVLNRPGRTAANFHGYPDPGMDAMYQVGATNGDIHLYETVVSAPFGTQLTGPWEADGRLTDPADVLDTSSRMTSFTDFSGLRAAGEWALYLADLESGGTNLLSEWSLEISGAITPGLNWPNPADIVYGTPLGASQLNALATFDSTNVPGTFTYNPASGSVLPAGLAQTLSVTFTPADAASFMTVSTNVALTVLPAPLTIAANNTNKLYGASLPSLTATYTGFVNGDGSANLTTPETLSTAATALSDLGMYPIVTSGASSSNYTISHLNGLLTVYTLNVPPVLAAFTNLVISPDGAVAIYVKASDANSDELTYDLEPGAPSTASITNMIRLHPAPVTNTIVRWVPTRAFASTTNLFTVRVTDNGAPAMSATQSFTVIVLDYLELTIGSTNSQAGQIVSVPITLASDRGVADLSFSIPWAPGYFTNAALSFTAPGVASGSLQNQTTNLLITMQTVPSQALQGTQQLAQLSFLAISNQQSAFIQLPFASPLAAKPDGSVYENYILHPGSVAAVQNQALLLPGRSLTGGRELTLFGKLGISYELQYATNVSSPTAWYPKLTYTQTNGLMTLDLDSANPSIFYRLLEQ